MQFHTALFTLLFNIKALFVLNYIYPQTYILLVINFNFIGCKITEIISISQDFN